MSSTNLPKAVLASPNQEERPEEASLTALLNARFYEAVRTNVNQSLQEMHQNRIKNIRKELNYLNETKWKYPPIEKFIGQ